mmetsp:Transcript_14853/g.21200  ORF Transcript_14853/g.21200 Transcript_14853/m.21200 type:complete len:83 (+) Transcript_14853:1061-1309(+)
MLLLMENACELYAHVGLMHRKTQSFGIMDPPREQVPMSISKFHDAGLKVFMVTDDQPLTGGSIAIQIGLLKNTNNIQLPHYL